ncbi:MAG: hypothetical protein ABL920_01285 [Methylotenera sp.]
MKLVILAGMLILFFIAVRLFGKNLSSETTRREWSIFWFKSSLFTGSVISLFYTSKDIYSKSGFFENTTLDSNSIFISLAAYFVVGFLLGLVFMGGYILKWKQ